MSITVPLPTWHHDLVTLQIERKTKRAVDPALAPTKYRTGQCQNFNIPRGCLLQRLKNVEVVDKETKVASIF